MQPNWRADSLAELGDIIWATLVRACEPPAAPWRLPALATTSMAGPQVRTVVLREAIPAARSLVAWTDVRSPKVRELRHDPKAQWLFHDPANGLQLRAITTVRIHHDDEVARAAWATVPAGNRANYQSVHAPGAGIARPISGGNPVAAGPAQFVALVATVQELDWLWLDLGGHRRARLRWSDGSWTGDWLVP